MRLVFLAISLLTVMYCRSESITFGFNQSFTGNNLQILLGPNNKKEHRFSFYSGIKIHLNPKNLWDERGYASFKKYYAVNSFQRFGLVFNLNFRLISNSNFIISYYFDTQNSFLARKYDTFIPYENISDSAGNIYVLRLKYTRKPQYVLEMNTGIDLNLKFSDKFFLLGAVGFGGVYQTHEKGGERVIDELSGNTILYGVDPEHPNRPDFDWFSVQIKLGIRYTLNSLR